MHASKFTGALAQRIANQVLESGHGHYGNGRDYFGSPLLNEGLPDQQAGKQSPDFVEQDLVGVPPRPVLFQRREGWPEVRHYTHQIPMMFLYHVLRCFRNTKNTRAQKSLRAEREQHEWLNAVDVEFEYPHAAELLRRMSLYRNNPSAGEESEPLLEQVRPRRREISEILSAQIVLLAYARLLTLCMRHRGLEFPQQGLDALCESVEAEPQSMTEDARTFLRESMRHFAKDIETYVLSADFALRRLKFTKPRSIKAAKGLNFNLKVVPHLAAMYGLHLPTGDRPGDTDYAEYFTNVNVTGMPADNPVPLTQLFFYGSHDLHNLLLVAYCQVLEGALPVPKGWSVETPARHVGDV